MKILVTGGSGLIGSAIVRKLLDLKHEVSVFDIKKSKYQDCNFFEGNVTDPERIKDVVRGHEIVIHLAATLGVINTETNPVKTLDTNMGGTRNVLEACAKFLEVSGSLDERKMNEQFSRTEKVSNSFCKISEAFRAASSTWRSAPLGAPVRR